MKTKTQELDDNAKESVKSDGHEPHRASRQNYDWKEVLKFVSRPYTQSADFHSTDFDAGYYDLRDKFIFLPILAFQFRKQQPCSL